MYGGKHDSVTNKNARISGSQLFARFAPNSVDATKEARTIDAYQSIKIPEMS